MVLSPSLRTDPALRLAMTPGLRQAIELLSFGNRRLGTHLARVAQRNPHVAVWLPISEDGLAAPAGGLADHVAGQIRIGFRSSGQRAIAFTFLEALEPWGWLGHSVAEIAARCECSLKDAEAVLVRLQGFDPPGLFARSLAECLRLQAAEQGLLDHVMTALLERLDLVAAGDMAALARHCRTDSTGVAAALSALRRFDPKPGLAFETAAPVRGADLVVTRHGDSWRVALNPATLPAVAWVDDVDAWNAPIPPGAAQEARGLVRAVERRNASMLAVGRAVVERQGAFLEGAAHAAPMRLAEVAGAVALHVSTVSRVVAELTADTPRGPVRLRALFGRGVPKGGAALPVGEVRDRIAALVAIEGRGEMLSDARIAAELRRDGVRITRRTVSKYRAELGIPALRDRRRERGS